MQQEKFRDPFPLLVTRSLLALCLRPRLAVRREKAQLQDAWNRTAGLVSITALTGIGFQKTS